MNTEAAIEHKVLEDGSQEWYQNNLLHRLDGPAYIGADGRQAWWQKNKLHRLDGPAVIWPDGTQSWWQNGLRHRLDGPALICPNGHQEWFVNGKKITQEVEVWVAKHNIELPLSEHSVLLFQKRFL